MEDLPRAKRIGKNIHGERVYKIERMLGVWVDKQPYELTPSCIAWGKEGPTAFWIAREFADDFDTVVEIGKYEAQLQAASQHLEKALPIGQVKSIGLMEVVTAIDQLIEERDDLQKMVRRFRR